MRLRFGRIMTIGAFIGIFSWCGLAVGQEISSQQLLDGLKDPSRWLTYSGDYSGQRHSPLTQITPSNVAQLSVQWAFQTGAVGKFEAVPIVIDGILYVTGPGNRAWAIDARTGRRIWSYQKDLPDKPGSQVNRGFAVLGNKLYVATLDSHLGIAKPNFGARVSGPIAWRPVRVAELPHPAVATVLRCRSRLGWSHGKGRLGAVALFQ